MQVPSFDAQPGFPDRAECPALIAGYVGLTVGVSHPVAQLREQGSAFAAWCDDLDPALRLRLGAAARRRIEAYQADAWGRSWIEELVALRRAQDFLARAPGKFSGTAAPAQSPGSGTSARGS